jgi:hypothetical protein
MPIGTTMSVEDMVAYVRVKRRGDKNYYYLVESKREGRKVTQHIIAYLGTKPPSEEEIGPILRRIRDEKNKL